MTRFARTMTAASLFLAFAMPAFAEGEDGEGKRRRRHRPPGVAIEACSASADQDACSFEGRRGGTLSGTCETMREQLVCVPEGHRARRAEREEEGA